MRTPREELRRCFLRMTACGAGALLAPAAYAHESKTLQTGRQGQEQGKEKKEELVTPGEDLMREHGVPNRVLLPHEAREDTVLFPAIQGLMTPESYAALGEEFA